MKTKEQTENQTGNCSLLNKAFAFFAIALLAISLIPAVIAQETESSVELGAETNAEADTDVGASVDAEVNITSPGVEPDSVLYGLDKAMDRIRLAFIRDRTRRAQIALEIAEERLAEAEAMAAKGKIEHAEKAEKEYDNSINEAENSADEIESDGNDEKAKEAWENLAGIKARILSHKEKVAIVKQRILERQADKMTEEQLAHLRAVFDRIINKSAEVDERAELKRGLVRAKYKVLANLTDEELAEIEIEIEERAGLAKVRLERARREVARAEHALELLEERLNRLEERLAGREEKLQELRQAIEEMRQKIAEARAARAEGEHEKAGEIAEEVKDFGNEVSLKARMLGEAKAEGNFEAALAELKEAAHARQAIAVERVERFKAEANETANAELRARIRERIKARVELGV